MPTGEQPSSSPPPAPAELEEKFPQFEILECLGRGGMGVVYKARQKALDRIVAIKILAGEFQDDPGFAARFEKEAKLLARLNHPNIVTIHDFGHAGGLFHIVMEYIDGVNVRDLLRDGRLEAQQALAIVPPICDALQFAHDHGVVHRDIKPENILLDREGRVKIADFGIATMAGEAADKSGTPAYMAPEVGGHTTEIDHRADIYSLGVVLYEMLTGERPAKQFEVPSNRVLVDVKIDQIVLRALQGRPELRYQTAGEFKTVVETMANAPTPPPAGTPTAPATFPPVREPRPVPEVAAAAKTLVDPSPAPAAAPAAVAAATPLGEVGSSKARLAVILMLVALLGVPLVMGLRIFGNGLLIFVLGLGCALGSLIAAIHARHSRTGKVVITTWCTLIGVFFLLLLAHALGGGDFPREAAVFVGGLVLAGVAVALALAARSSAVPERETERRWALILMLGAIFGTPLLMSLVPPQKEGIIFFLGVGCAIASLVFAIRARGTRTGKAVLGVWGVLLLISLGSILLNFAHQRRVLSDAQTKQAWAEYAEANSRLSYKIEEARKAIQLSPDAEPRIRISFDDKDEKAAGINGINFDASEFYQALERVAEGNEGLPVRILSITPHFSPARLGDILNLCSDAGLKRISFWNAPDGVEDPAMPVLLLELSGDEAIGIGGERLGLTDPASAASLKNAAAAQPKAQVRILAPDFEASQPRHKRDRRASSIYSAWVNQCQSAGFKRIFFTTEAEVARSWQAEFRNRPTAGAPSLPPVEDGGGEATPKKGLAISASGMSIRIELGQGVPNNGLGMEGFITGLKPLVEGKDTRQMSVEVISPGAQFPHRALLDLLLACRHVGLKQVSFTAKAKEGEDPEVPPLLITVNGDELPKIGGVAVEDLPAALKRMAATDPQRPVKLISKGLGLINPSLSDTAADRQLGRMVETLKFCRDFGFQRIYFTTSVLTATVWETEARHAKRAAAAVAAAEAPGAALPPRGKQAEPPPPAPPTELERKLEELERFMNEQTAPKRQPAIAHAPLRIALKEDGSMTVEGKALAGEALLQELQRLKAERGGDPYVEIVTENSTSYTVVTELLDLCTRAGLTNLNLLQPVVQGEEPPLPKAEPDPAQGIVLPGPPDHPPTQIFIDEDGFLLLDDEMLKLEELGPKLAVIAREDPYRKILVTGEQAATHARVLAVLKACKEANLTQVSYQRAADRLREIELSAALKGYQDLQERLREARLKRDLLAAEGDGVNAEELKIVERVIEVLEKAIAEEREKVKKMEE